MKADEYPLDRGNLVGGRVVDEHLVYLGVREADAFFHAPAEDLLPRLFERTGAHHVFGVSDDLLSVAVITEPVFDMSVIIAANCVCPASIKTDGANSIIF